MRLLKYGEDGELTITSFHENELPRYAILSHTWGADHEEVTFADLEKGDGMAKPGYEKIRFCGEQAQRDNLQYFWIDTCCIDKENHAELSLAINSMFRWYRNSARCYVYLSDVSSLPLDTNPACKPQQPEFQKSGWVAWVWTFLVIGPLLRWYQRVTRRFFLLSDVSSPQACESELQKSRWFTRGWTLQELLAPSRVEFFSREHRRLGDRTSLTDQIHKRTGIPKRALEGAPLSLFSDKERFFWIQCRQTKIEEDKAYSLLGIFGVEMPLRYGEGSSSAFKRLEEEVNKLNNCLQDLRSSDPGDDKKRIEETKGGLLTDSYRWILNNTTFQQWQQDLHNRLLWVKGDPGKGKTMLLCGIVDFLHSSMPKTALMSYFFCQATDSRINSATAVVRGLLYMLVKQQPSLVSHIRKKHDSAGKTLFEDANAWVALTEIFADVLQDPNLNTTYLIIDALDECVTDRSKLIKFIARQSASCRVKWVVSSRNWPEIEKELEQAGHKIRLSLELNAESVSAAVHIFVVEKVNQLAKEKQWKAQTQDAVLQHLTSNANDTFLWVALVCQDLGVTANRHVQKKLALFPPGLDALYEQMMHQMSETDDAEVCRHVLASTALLYRPVTIPELVALVEQLAKFDDDLESVREIVSLCGSFLTVRKDTVYFVHQSAKDFLFANSFNEVFPDGAEEAHYAIFSRSLAKLSRTLHRNMYSLKAIGDVIDNVTRPDPDPLADLRYQCVFWIDHLYDSKPKLLENNDRNFQTRELVYEFLKTKYLYWLEGLSLCKNLGRGVVSMAKLLSLVQVCEQSIET